MPKSGDLHGHHNKGQEDYSKGKNDPPHENMRDNWFASYSDKDIADRQAYRAGREEAKSKDKS